MARRRSSRNAWLSLLSGGPANKGKRWWLCVLMGLWIQGAGRARHSSEMLR